MLTLALLASLAAPVVRVAVEGDDPVVGFVRARLSAAGLALVEPNQADVRVRLRVLEHGGIHVVVEDRRGVLVDRDLDGDEPQVAAWLAVRDAVERVDVSAPPPSTQKPAPLPVAVDVLAGAAPDVGLSSTSFFPVALVVSARWPVVPHLRIVADAGYAVGFSSGVVLHSLPVRFGAEATGGDDVEWSAGARVSTTPSLAVSGSRAGGGVGAAVAAYGRVAFPLGRVLGLDAAAVVEAGLESKLVREVVVTDAGTRQEPLFAAPVSVGVEVRL